MAKLSSSTTNSEELNLFKSVQELVENSDQENDQVPDAYIWRDTSSSSSSSSDYGPVDPTAPLIKTEIPVIDLSRLIQSSSQTGGAMDAELRSALGSWGCFQVINHGIEDSFLDHVRDVSRQFFHLPMKEKQKCARAVDDMEGYGNDMVLFEDQSLDWVDRIYLLVSPKDQQKLEYWPENPQSFRNMLHEYAAKLEEIQEQLLKSIARSLSLPEDCFSNQFGERHVRYARFNYYPPCSRPDLVFGLKPHGDGSGITILLQDKEVGGLQFLKDNQWFQVPILPHALLVNVGDQLEIMSNGIFKSPVHRAVTNSDGERITLAMFCSPASEIEIEPLQELVDEKNPRLYKKVRDYAGNYFHFYQRGKRPLDAVRV